ncbi:SET domain-containing protein [candidate division TA06 bacterium]|uniref:SET domain-containing protein n=1 Tax=candidate division TA06 bacterium TaxID=2250710 RepID=A0A933MJA6_UNCT6|nr:SET domain-containing protein [candidate division TA06 bacterium]
MKKIRNKGQGLFANKFIPRGTIVFFECRNCQVTPNSRFQKLSPGQKKKLLFHAYTVKDGLVVMPCGDSKYMNHCCDSNILDTGKGYDIVVRDIKKGQEATCDYRVFYDKEWGFKCACGSPNCCGILRCRHPLPRGVRALWDKKLKPAQKLVKKVSQLLKEELIKHDPKFKRLFIAK